jgi:hypothetical protein
MDVNDFRPLLFNNIKSDTKIVSGIVPNGVHHQVIVDPDRLVGLPSTDKVNRQPASRERQRHVVGGYAYSCRPLAGDGLVDKDGHPQLSTQPPEKRERRNTPQAIAEVQSLDAAE